MRKFKPMKLKDSSVRLPEEFLDTFLLNDGDYLVLVEENGKFYLRKTFEERSETPDQETKPPPPSLDEMMKKAQEQFSEMPVGSDFMKTVENTLNDPEMMKKLKEMAEGMFKGMMNPNTDSSENKNKSDEDNSENKKASDEDEDEDEDSGYKIDIE